MNPTYETLYALFFEHDIFCGTEIKDLSDDHKMEILRLMQTSLEYKDRKDRPLSPEHMQLWNSVFRKIPDRLQSHATFAHLTVLEQNT